MVRGARVAVSALPLLLGACEQTVPDGAQVEIRGTVIADGAPAIDQRVFLHRDSTWGETLGGTGAYPVALALLSCLLEEVDTVGSCDAYKTTTTDDEGAFVFSLLGSETKNEFDQSLGFEASVNNGHAGLAGAVTTTHFEIWTEEMSLGELELWPSGPAVNASETEVLVDWSSVGVQEDDSWTTVVRFFVAQESVFGLDQLAGLLWAERLAEGESLAVPLQVLQDQEAAVRIQDYARDTVRTSPAVRIQGSLTPVSRGAQCVFTTSLETRTDSPCRLTDGDFVKVFEGAPKVCVEKESDASANTDEARRETAPLSQCAETGFEEVIVDLGSSDMRSELFVHASAVGLPFSLVVSVSEDGIAFEDLADEVLPFSRIPIGREARFIRFRREVAIGEDAVGVLEFFVNEMSVF